MQDLCIAEGITNALGLQRFGKGRRRAVNGLEVSTLHRPIQEAVEVLTAYLAHSCALFPLGEGCHAKRFTVHWGLVVECLGAVAQDWQINAFPGLVASVGNELPIGLN